MAQSLTRTLLYPGLLAMRRMPPAVKLPLLGAGAVLTPFIPVAMMAWWPDACSAPALWSVAAGAGLVQAYLWGAHTYTVLASMRVLRESVAQLAQGDLATRIHLRQTDELYPVGQTMDEVTGVISQMVSDIRSNSTMVAQTGIHMAEDTRGLAGSVQGQGQSLAGVSSRVRDINQAIGSNAASVRAVDEQIDAVRGIAEAGGVSVHSAVSSVQDIQHSSRKMQEIIAVIEGISFQTNILALNAAVEAARAGEQGRGFAVVAGEVRSLAQRSANSAKEIKQLIQASVEHVDVGVRQIHSTQEAFERILMGIRGVAEEVRNIAHSTQAQSQALDEVTTSVAELEDSTRNSAGLVQQASDSSAQLSERARRLSDAVSSFRLRQGSADEALTLVQQAMQVYRAQGSASFTTITQEGRRFADRDMYVFVFDRRGVYKAFAGKPEKVGTNVCDVPGVDGAKLIRDAFERASFGGGWVDYAFANPQTGRTDLKTSYVEAVGEDMVMGCGVYKRQDEAREGPRVTVSSPLRQRPGSPTSRSSAGVRPDSAAPRSAAFGAAAL